MAGGMALEARDLAAHPHMAEIRLDRALNRLGKLGNRVFRQVRAASIRRRRWLSGIAGYDTRARIKGKRRESSPAGGARALRVLVVGSGGREHALCWAISSSPLCDALFCAPGNPGIADEAACVDIAATDNDGILKLCKKERIDFVVVGPEAPLVGGLVDKLEAAGIAAFGPTAAGRRARRLQGLHQGPLRQIQHPDAGLSALHRRRRRQGLRPATQGAHRGQGGRARRRQGRHRGRDHAPGASPRSTPPWWRRNSAPPGPKW